MRLALSILAVAIGACVGAPDDATPDVPDAPDAPADASTAAAAAAAVTLLGACQRPGGADALGRVVFEGHYRRCVPPEAPDALTLTDEAAWQPVRADLARCAAESAAAPGSVDFASEYVVVLGVAAFQTCGLRGARVWALAGAAGPYVELEITDPSAGCTIACAMGDAYVVAVSVPRSAGEAPTLCRRVHHGCP